MIDEFVQAMLAALQLTITMCTAQLRGIQAQADAGQEIDFKRFDALTKKLVDAAKEFNRHQAATLRRDQFEFRRAAEMEKIRQTEQALQVVEEGRKLHAEIDDATMEYAEIVRQSHTANPDAPVPGLTQRLANLIRGGGQNPDSPAVRKRMQQMLVQMGALPPVA